MELIRQQTTEYTTVYQWAARQGLLEEVDASVIFYDFDILDNRLDYLRRQFPQNTLHAVAIKSNPLGEVLSHIGQRGFGLESASWEETLLAQRAGVPAERIVFDSPVKTQREIDWCAANLPDLHLNANSLAELERLPAKSDLRVGLRINPLVDPGSPDEFNVSTSVSKFGVPISQWSEIVEASVRYPCIRGLHLHIGSEISRPTAPVTAVRKVLDLAKAIREARAKANIDAPLTFVDIGGGFPARYEEGPQPDLSDFLAFLRKQTPELFTDYRIITEYGRFVQAHTAWLVSDVEYVLQPGPEQPDVPIVHCGADLLLREIYQPNGPKHQLAVLDNTGQLKSTDTWPVHLAGPLCFAGDYLTRGQALPRMEPGDKVVVADIGANSFSMWSRHCSRVFPKVIGYSQREGWIRVIKPREDVENVVRFWGGVDGPRHTVHGTRSTVDGPRHTVHG